MLLISNNIETFFSQLPENNNTVRIKEELRKEFYDKFESFQSDGLGDNEALSKADECFSNLSERFPNLLEERDFMIEVSRGVDIINNCSAVCYILYILIVLASYVYPLLDSKYDMSAGSFGDYLGTGILAVIVLVIFVVCRIPDRMISKKAIKHIVKEKKKGLQLGNIALTYFLFPYVFSSILVLVGVILFLIEIF